MSALRPERLRSYPLLQLLVNAGLKLVHSGKIRDSFDLGEHEVRRWGRTARLRLVVTTDGVSIFDFVLNALIPNKGKTLNALTVFWHQTLLCTTHLVAWGRDIDRYLPLELCGNPELWARAMVVIDCQMRPVEAIVRGYLTGSGWVSYQQIGRVCGIELPPGLHDGSRLPEPIFTPTTKAEAGHDEHLSAAEVTRLYPWMPNFALILFKRAHEHALSRGVIIADTKFEFGSPEINLDGELTTPIVVADEILTPDSSRFWDVEEWEQAQADDPPHAPKPNDKQGVRDWGKGIGIDKADPNIHADVDWVHKQTVPDDLLEETAAIYIDICQRLTGQTPDEILRL